MGGCDEVVGCVGVCDFVFVFDVVYFCISGLVFGYIDVGVVGYLCCLLNLFCVVFEIGF